MPSYSCSSIDGGFNENHSPENKIYDDLNYEDLLDVYEMAKFNALEKCNSLIIFDDVQKRFKEKEIQKLLLYICNNRRHMRISVWCCYQNYFQIPKQNVLG